MAEIKQIQCPSCGGNSTFRQRDGSYKCNYCQNNFELKGGSASFQKFPTLDEIKSLNKPQRSVNVAMIIGMIAALLAVVGGFVAFFLLDSGD